MKFKSFALALMLLTSTATGISCDDSGSVQPATQTPEVSEYRQRVKIINENVSKYYYESSTGLYYDTKDRNQYTYLWGLCGMIQAANEEEALDPSGSYMAPIVKAINEYYSTKAPVPGYNSGLLRLGDSDRYYDDNQWIAIAYMDAYNRTGNTDYLDKADEIYRFMMTGYDSRGGGGIYWKEGDKSSKNTCSNGPGILVALQLYKVKKEQSYLDNALKIYNWTNTYLLSPEGVYYDNVKIPSMDVDFTQYTYNTGTMLQSNVLLYEITKDEKYLTEARRVAKAAIARFYQGDSFPDNYWFNAVMLRGFAELYKVDKDKSILTSFVKAADYVWDHERDKNNLLGSKKEILEQAGMLEIYARLEQLGLK
jgi:rhamnogalacturonyl hydrolase YesR